MLPRYLPVLALPVILGIGFLRPGFAGEQAVAEAGSRDTAGVPVPKAEQPSPVVLQQRRERDDLQREDVAGELARMGLPLQWLDFSLEQLTDWRDRMQAAQALQGQHGVIVDWRTQSLASLTDMRLRAAKASALATLYGVQVDWRRYSWVALEALRRQVAKFPGRATGDETATGNTLARPGTSGAIRRRVGFHPSDPDAILEPTFAFDTPAAWSHPFGRRSNSGKTTGRMTDPDAILVPTFVNIPSPPVGPDDIIDPWSPRRASFGP